jgi:short-chain Z-isoprenyl diphosphate synthase
MLDALPGSTARALKDAVEATRDCATGAHVTLAIGYRLWRAAGDH